MSTDAFYDYVKKKAEKGGWVKIDGGYVQASALLSQMNYARSLRTIEETYRKRKETYKKELEEAAKNEELIRKGLHPIYSRVPGVKDFKVENGIIYERYYLSGGAWTEWRPVKKVIQGVNYYLIPGLGIYNEIEIMNMAKNGTLKVKDLLNLPPEMIAKIVRAGHRQIMGMNEELWESLRKMYDPDDVDKMLRQINEENANFKEIFQQVMTYLSQKAKTGQLDNKDRELLDQLARKMMDPKAIAQFFGIEDLQRYAHNLAGVPSSTQESNFLWDFINNVKNWVEGAANSFDNWIANTFNLKQPIDYLTDAINTALTVFGLKPLESQDREYLEKIAHLAGFATYSELITSIIGAIAGWKLAGTIAGGVGKVAPEVLGYLGATEIPKAVNPTWIKIAGAGAGMVAGAQLGESLSWMALNVRNQAQSMIKALDTQENIAKDRNYDNVRSKLITVGEYVDLIKSAYYQKDWNTMASALSEANGILNETMAYIEKYKSELNSLGVYDELRALVDSYRSVLQGYVSLAQGKGASLPALTTAMNSTRVSTLAISNATTIKEEKPYASWDDLELIRAYLNYVDAVNHGRTVLTAASSTVEADTLGTGVAVVPTLPMPHANRVEFLRTLSTTREKESYAVKPRNVGVYVAPSKDYTYYKALLSDWATMGLTKRQLMIIPDWIKSIVNMAPKFYQSGKERGYWYPYEMLALVVLMLLTGLDLNGLMYLFNKYPPRS